MVLDRPKLHSRSCFSFHQFSNAKDMPLPLHSWLNHVMRKVKTHPQGFLMTTPVNGQTIPWLLGPVYHTNFTFVTFTEKFHILRWVSRNFDPTCHSSFCLVRRCATFHRYAHYAVMGWQNDHIDTSVWAKMVTIGSGWTFKWLCGVPNDFTKFQNIRYRTVVRSVNELTMCWIQPLSVRRHVSRFVFRTHQYSGWRPSRKPLVPIRRIRVSAGL